MIGVGTGKGFLVYQPLWIVEFVQEKAIWCTNRLESWVLYRKRPSGVPTALNRGVCTGKAVWCTNALNRGVCTGKGRLVYQLHWIMDLVQEKAFWCTNRLESWIWYRKRPSGVPTALSRGVCTGKGRLVYQRLESWILGSWDFSGVQNSLIGKSGYDWVCGHWDCWSDWWKCKVSLQWVLNFFTLLEKWLIAKILTNN